MEEAFQQVLFEAVLRHWQVVQPGALEPAGSEAGSLSDLGETILPPFSSRKCLWWFVSPYRSEFLGDLGVSHVVTVVTSWYKPVHLLHVCILQWIQLFGAHPCWEPELFPPIPLQLCPRLKPLGVSPMFAILLSLTFVVKQMLRGQVYLNESFFHYWELHRSFNTFGSWKINAITLSSNTRNMAVCWV